jgi:hypothetical protein
MADGRVLEIFRGVERGIYGHLANGEVGMYLRAAPRIYKRWHGRQLPGAVLSVGRDGTVLVARIIDARQETERGR